MGKCRVVISFTYDPQTHRLYDNLGFGDISKAGPLSIREFSALLEIQKVSCTPTLPAFITATIPINPITIQYTIEPSAPAIVATKIYQAIDILQANVPGVRWIKDTTYNTQVEMGKLVIHAKLGDGCWSNLGVLPKGNMINIDPNWTAKEPGQGPPIGTILHELLHTLGVAHEHQRSDRHEYVEVDDAEVKSDEVNYGANATVHPFRYDYASIMHYPSGTGLKPPPKAWAKVGQRDCLSPLDKLFVNWLYPPPKQHHIYEPKMSMRTGLWYCGRRVMENHNYPFSTDDCDGFCGPTNGPNCPSCVIYGIGCGNSFPLQRINKQGIVSSQGETGLFYCGRVMKTKVSSAHDRKCGPNNGPNCLECDQYLD